MKNIIKKINRNFVLGIIIVAMFLLYAPFYAKALTVSEVEDNVKCVSCREEALNTCRSGCGDQMRAEIKRMIKEGKTKDEILDYYVKMYGETILTTPPKRGFNLVAYIAPFIGLIIGAAVAFFLIKKWGGSVKTSGNDVNVMVLSNEMRKKVDDELNKLKEDE